MDASPSLICHECIGDLFLKARAKAEGKRGRCDLCGRIRKCVAVEDLKSWIDEVFTAQFRPGPGQEAHEIFSRIAGISRDLAFDMVDDLSQNYGHLDALGKSTDPYAFEAYVLDGPDEDESDDRWRAFSKTVRQEARYFNRSAEQWLENIFTGLHDQRTWSDEGVIQTIEPGATSFWRARLAESETTLLNIVGSPHTELGPPPNGSASAGRMNAAGVSVFYGAVTPETCISEIRAPVGAWVVMGRFTPTRRLRILDVDRLAQIDGRISHFDPDYTRKRERVDFLRAFGRQIAQPVMPSDQGFGYLPTQVVADFLAQRQTPAIDGLFYRSTQTGSADRNIVLFNRAARVEPLSPTLQYDVDVNWRPGEEDDTIWMSLKPADPSSPPKPGYRHWMDERPMTLQLDLASLEVRRISETHYKTESRAVYLHRAGAAPHAPDATSKI
jgi:hypothetical protein